MPKPKPNEKCTCGSGKKYKKCCHKKTPFELFQDRDQDDTMYEEDNTLDHLTRRRPTWRPTTLCAKICMTMNNICRTINIFTVCENMYFRWFFILTMVPTIYYSSLGVFFDVFQLIFTAGCLYFGTCCKNGVHIHTFKTVVSNPNSVLQLYLFYCGLVCGYCSSFQTIPFIPTQFFDVLPVVVFLTAYTFMYRLSLRVKEFAKYTYWICTYFYFF